MPYSLQSTSQPFKGGKNILASEHVQFIEGGATIKAGEGVLECGQAIARETATGKWVKFVDANVDNYDDFGILNVDVDATDNDVIVGEVIVRGSVYDAKLVGATATFKGKVPNIRFVNHI
jgi:hypothetical protein